MDKTNPSEAAAASSPYLSEGMLRAQANPDCAFPDAVQVLSREVLRLRAQCPPTAEVERMRNALMACAKAAHPNAFGHIRAGDVHIDFLCEDVQKEVGHLRADRDAWKRTADTLGGDLNRIRALVPTASDEQTTFDAVQAYLETIGKERRDLAVERDKLRNLIAAADCEFLRAGTVPLDGKTVPVDAAMRELANVVAESKRDRAEKQQALLDEIARLVPGKGTLTERVARLANFYRDAHDADMDRYGFAQLRLIGEDIGAFYDPGIGTRKSVAKLLRAYSDKAYQVERLQFECEARTGRSTCPATGGVVGASDFLKAMRTTEPKPEVARKPVRDLVDEALRMVRGKMREAPNFAFDPAEPLGSKVAPATGQPRTEVPLAADGSGTLFADLVKAGKAIYLGEVFYKALEHADPDFFGSPQFLDGKTDEESRYRHLYCAVRELAKVVERIGAR